LNNQAVEKEPGKRRRKINGNEESGRGRVRESKWRKKEKRDEQHNPRVYCTES
jgi:hypothetical protein